MIKQGIDILYELQPYPGLRSFETTERGFFFGRERQLDELLRKLRSSRFLAISGSGKSSLAKAALVPRLKDGFAGQAGSQWRVAVCTVGDSPIKNLTKQLAQRAVLYGDTTMEPNYPATVEALLRRGNMGIVEAYKQANIKKDNLMIIVDQFDDIFSYIKKGEEAAAEAALFVSLLLTASRQKEQPIYVVFTMRSSSFGHATEFRTLPEAINDGQFLIPRMKHEELKKAILAPAIAAGVMADMDISVSPELANKIVDEAGEDFDDLAILQHTLMRTWLQWQKVEEAVGYNDNPIGVKHYDAVGGLKTALELHVEEAFKDFHPGDEPSQEEIALSQHRQNLTERMFKLLSDKASDGKPIRRMASVREIMKVTQSSLKEVSFVINVFSQKGREFLSAPEMADMDEDSSINIAHECLLNKWQRLNAWVEEEHSSSETYIRMSEAAARYYADKGSLWQDPELSLGLKWAKPSEYDMENPNRLPPTEPWAQRYNTMFVETIKFLEDSEAKHKAALASIAHDQESRMRRATLIAAFSALFALVCILLLGVAIVAGEKARQSAKKAYLASQKSERDLQIAELSKQNAKYAEAQAKISEALAAAESNKASNATRTALDAALAAEKSRLAALQSEALAKKKAKEAEEAAKLAKIRELQAIASEKAALLAQQKAEDATREALRIKAWSLAQSLAVKSMSVEDERVEALLAKEAYDLNTVSDGKPFDAYIYEALYAAMDKLNPAFNSLEDAPEGVKRIGTVRAIVPSKDGEHLYTTGSEGYLLKWVNRPFDKASEHKLKSRLPAVMAHQPTVYRTMLASNDYKYIIRANEKGEIEIFNALKDKEPPRIVKSHNGSAITAMVLLGNKGIITSGKDGTLFYTTIADGRTSMLTELDQDTDEQGFIDMAISPDGKYLFGIPQNGSKMIVLNLEKNAQVETDLMDLFSTSPVDGSGDIKVSSVAQSPDGNYLALGYSDGVVRIWDLTSPDVFLKKPEPMHYHSQRITDLQFSHDSRQLAAASMDNVATLWQIKLKSAREGESLYPYQEANFVPIKLKDHNDWVMSVAFSKDNSRLFTGTQDGQIKLWETDMMVYADQICPKVDKNLSDKAWRKYVGTDDPETDAMKQKLYILTPDLKRRAPFSTCGGDKDQLIDAD
jgi:WD40 repeat protein